jgi:hypothetical protein
MTNLIKRANEIHNNKYDYSLVTYKNNKNKIKIVCPKHGVFQQRIDHHLRGSGCQKCVNRAKTNEELIYEYRVIHGNRYDYSLVDYENALTKIKIICPEHGVFEIHSRQHLKGVCCGKCQRIRIAESSRKTTDQFIKKANQTHNGKYDYSLTSYVKAIIPVIILCPLHGKFNQIPRSHIKGAGCPICKESKGERQIRIFLDNRNTKFIRQHKFNGCKNIRELPFDFYLPEYNFCIEYHGEQHSIAKNFFGGQSQLEYIQLNDRIKYDYCKNNNIKLLIIDFLNYKEINSILLNYLTP